jgi:hypothetical protein
MWYDLCKLNVVKRMNTAEEQFVIFELNGIGDAWIASGNCIYVR